MRLPRPGYPPCLHPLAPRCAQGEVALHMACANESKELVELLVKHKADVVGPHAAGKFFFTNPSICAQPPHSSAAPLPFLAARTCA